MEIIDQYQTIAAPAEGIYKEKGSKFLSFAYNVTDQETIRQHVSRIQKEYFDARHCCYAWHLGLKPENFRANDDGEPSGTAGKPIHGQILSHQLTNILIVVVRYFGGIKLGTSGLINAYRTAAADAIANAEIVVRPIEDYYSMTFAYQAMNDVMSTLKDFSPRIIEQNFDLDCHISFAIRQKQSSGIAARLQAITSVKIRWEQTI